jgi:hypothetical protein
MYSFPKLRAQKLIMNFINSQTWNIIAHLSLSVTLDKNEHAMKLEKYKDAFGGFA